MPVLDTFFGWPDGSVWGNLFASLLWSVPLWSLGYYRIKRQHTKHIDSLHNHIDQQFAKLTDEKSD